MVGVVVATAGSSEGAAPVATALRTVHTLYVHSDEEARVDRCVKLIQATCVDQQFRRRGRSPGELLAQAFYSPRHSRH